jgi:hypothetical protein
MSTLYYEAKLAKALGISRPEFKKLRKSLLKFEADWQMHGNQVVITEAGIEKLRVYFAAGGIGSKYCEIAEAQVDYQPPTGEVELVVKQVYPNPRLLLCVFPAGHGEPDLDKVPILQQVRVRVPRNDNFKPKMTIKARKLTDGFYELVGRCPRYPGRW